MYVEVKGDLLQMADAGHFDFIVHGCNCFCVMGAGIAKQIAGKYPTAQYADMTTKPGDPGKLGAYTVALHQEKETATLFRIVNAYTQYHPGTTFRAYYLQTFLDTLLIDFPELRPNGTKKYTIGFPQIGCGIGGGKWEEVRFILQYWADENQLNVTVVIYEKPETKINWGKEDKTWTK